MPAFTSFAIAAGATAATVGAVSSIKQGKAQKKMAEQQAGFEEASAADRERDFRRETGFILAARRAGLGAQGVTAEGTPSLVDDSVVTESELQALRIRSGGEAQARILRQAGSNAQTAGFVRGGASLLSGIGNVASLGSWGSGSGAGLPAGSYVDPYGGRV